MAGIDDKVVAISFESSKFEQGVNKTISSLEKLKAALHFPNAGKGLSDIDAAANRVNMSRLTQGIEGVKQSLGALRLVGVAVFAAVATAAVRAGAQIAKSLTIGPIIDGYKEYALNLQSIQTILANTQVSGATLRDVNSALNELNRYSDKTIYNFGQMAKNIGTFTAAGVDLDSSVAAIKGIANLAALSGSNADQASTAMYQLSQALSAGRVTLMDWNSVVNAGMGGAVFQRALAQTAEAMGTLKKGTVELTGPMKTVTIAGQSFRNSLSAPPGKTGWLTSKVLTNTLKQFTADMTDAELAAMGFNQAQITAIQQTAKTAMHAATEVKTITQVFDVAKETMGSGWAQTFSIIFGNFTEAKTTFTALSNAINGFINTNANARNKVLADWKALGGRTVLLKSIGTMFHNLGLIIAPIKEAFRDIFPAQTGKSLMNLTNGFRDFANALKPSQQTIDNLKSTFRGLFAFLDIGKQIISGVFTMFGKMFGALGVGSGGFLKLTGSVGDFIYALDQSLKKGDGINKFFAGLGTGLAKPIELITRFAHAIGTLFAGFSPIAFVKNAHDMTLSLVPFHQILENVGIAWDKFTKKLNDSLKTGVLSAFKNVFSGLGDAFAHMFQNMNFESVLAVIRTGLFGALVVMFHKFLGRGSILTQLTQGFFGNTLRNFGLMAHGLGGVFNTLSGTLVSFQNNLKAKTLKEIAISIALLSASIVALSLADPKKVSKAMGSMTLMFGELLGAMAILNKITASGAFIKLPIMAVGLVLLAGAIDILAIAVAALSLLDWNQLAKGLTGVGALLAGVTVAAGPLSASSARLIFAGIGITGIAVALNIMALAVRQLGNLNMAELSKGLAGVAVGLGSIAGVMTAMPKGMILQSAALNAIAISLNIMAAAVSKLAQLSWQQLAKGLAGLAGGLVAIAAAMTVMPKGMVLQAAGLVLVSFALGKIAAAIALMGGLSVKEIAKGIITLAAALVVLAGGMTAMSGTVSGAAALTVAAFGISMLAKALVKMGGMSWKSMIKSLIMLAAALGIIGVAALALTPATPALLAFGLAMLGIGAGLALAGAGIFLISAGLSALAVAGPAAVGVMLAAMTAFLHGMIENAKLIALAVLSIVEAFARVAPKFVDAMLKIIEALLQGVIKIAPKLVPVITALIDMLVNVLAQNQDKIIKAGIDLIIALLNGIRANIGQVVKLVADIIVQFLNALSANLGRIIAAGSNLLIKFVEGVTKAITAVPTAVVKIITQFLATITSNLTKIVTAGGQMIVKLVEGIGKTAKDVVTAGTKAITSFITAIGNAGPQLIAAGVTAALKLVNAMANEIPRAALGLYQAARQMIINLAFIIGFMAGDFSGLGVEIAIALMQGLIAGFTGWLGKVLDKIRWVGDQIKAAWNKVLSIFSPSHHTTWLGQMMMEGLIVGMDDGTPKTLSAVNAAGLAVIQAFKDVFQTNSPSKVMMEIGKFVGQGFAEGLRGSQTDIRNAFAELNAKLTDAMKTARETIASEQKKLKELRAADKPDAKAIAEAQKIIDQNQAILARSIATHQAMTGALSGLRVGLSKLAGEYDVVSARLDKAKQKLADAKSELASVKQSVSDQYGALPPIGPSEDEQGQTIDQLAAYEDSLKKQAEATEKYAETLKKLRALGLDDATYQKLLNEGPDAQNFASALLAGGATAVQSINQLDRDLTKQSDKLATTASKELKQAGVNAAQALVDGLTSKKKELAAAMADIALLIVKAVKDALGIKSPSTVMIGIGKFMVQGLVDGLSGASKMVADAASGLVDDAMSAMNKSIGAMSDMVMGTIDANPVITPVLDLTLVKSQAKELGYLTNVTPISAAASYGQASQISASQAQSFEEQQLASGGTHVTFEQNNYSPASLTEIEIYRQTKNQLSQLKSSLA